MEVVFLINEKVKTPENNNNRLELYPDKAWDSNSNPWDDFGFKTTFRCKLFFENQVYDMPFIKILIEDNVNTHEYFKNIILENQQNYFYFPLKCKYISLPTDIEFYESLKSLLDEDNVNTILSKLCDSILVENTNNFIDRKYLLQEDGFSTSLLRDMTSRSAFSDGWKIIQGISLDKDIEFSINFRLVNFMNDHKIDFNFKKSIFPNNINILIGSNGTGKSQTISHLIEELLSVKEEKQKMNIPVFNQIVMIAYSPFEKFRTSLLYSESNIKSIYKYIGFRDKEDNFDINRPNSDSIDSLINIIKEDDKKSHLKTRVNKYNTLISVLKKAIDFDTINIQTTEKITTFFNDGFELNGKYYFSMDKNVLFDYEEIIDKIEINRGLHFVKDHKIVQLSSGQAIFVQLITNIISSIRKDTLLLIDEPELYLHPNLEVELMELLKQLLNEFDSYSIIATHSAIIAREVSKDYIKILKRRPDNTIEIFNPPFEIIGGNMERINDYVFFDKDVPKPYQKWLQNLVNKYGSSDEVIEKYKNDLNEESLILLSRMEPINAI